MRDRLFPGGDIPGLGAAGPVYAAAINELLDKINKMADATVIPAVVGGVVDNTSMIEDKVGEALDNGNGTVRFVDPGPVGVTAIPTIRGAVRVAGAGGEWGTRLVPLEDTADPILDFDAPGTGDIWALYGPSIDRLAVDLAAAPSSVGIFVSPTTGRFVAEHFTILGGYRCLDIRGANARITKGTIGEASDTPLHVTDTGFEIRVHDLNITRNTPGEMDAYAKFVSAVGGLVDEDGVPDPDGFPMGLGMIDLHSIICQGNARGGAVLNAGMIFSAPDMVNASIFARQVTIDNVTGGGPGVTLENWESVDWSGGWINSAGSPGGPCVRIDGGSDIAFHAQKYRGGGATPKTFDLLGTITGLQAYGSYDPTGPVFYFNPGATVTDLYFNDRVPAATALSQITNDVEKLVTAAMTMWGPHKLGSRLSFSEVPWVGEPFMNLGTLGDGGIPGETIIAAPDVDAFFSQFFPFRFSPAGVRGRLEVASKDATANTVTVQSVNAAGTVEVDDTSIVGVLRFEIPH